ncbi:MAG: holo-ACP synthase [Candidatus Hydrogenedentes bacterium]|nr:holo-ACP synthase [Candidatus Hydrogenedentota bacterium]
MILGIGADLVDVPDFERRVARRSLLKVFSAEEIRYADSQPKRRTEILAARWAAKEAFLKTLGTGLRVEWPLDQIEVVHDDAGRPSLKLGPRLAGLIPPGAAVHLTISHTPKQAIAVIIIEGVRP